MTVLTQALSEKKLQSKHNDLKQPLVDPNNEESLPSESAPQVDIENGSTVSLSTLRSRAQRVNNLTTLCVTLSALLVLTTGIVGGIILYRHFAQYRLRHFRGWCNIPYNQETARYEELYQPSRVPVDNSRVFDAINVENMINEFTNQLNTNEANSGPLFDNKPNNGFKNFFGEEFDIDLEFEQYEEIQVPNFSNGRKGRFIHDFSKNMTGIIDIDSGRCFVLPLNRSNVLPPQTLYDLLMKMKSGYYDIDTEIVREMYRVKTPPIKDFKNLGYYIGRECAKLPTYRLERITSPVYKRSVSSVPKVIFHEFAGVKIQEFQIVNLIDAKGKH